MTREDFISFNIRYIKPAEVMATGATLASVQARLIQHLDIFRAEIGKPIHLLKNGLTTGDHTSQEHDDGIASDIAMPPIAPGDAFKKALGAGFKGIGLYWNGKWTSMHLDLRSEYGFWIGVRVMGNRKATWDYRPLIVEPV